MVGVMICPKVSIIVLNYNQPITTVKCINSLFEQDYLDFEILIIDNGSIDNSKDVFTKNYASNPKIKLIFNKKNLGYAGGINLGAKHARGIYIVMLNNDMVFEKDFIKWLVISLESSENVKIVNPIMLEMNYTNKKELSTILINKIRLKYKKIGHTCNILGYGGYYHRKGYLKNH